MHSSTENVSAWVLDDSDLSNSVTGLTENDSAWVPDYPDSPNLIKGLRKSIVISLLLWTVIILALVKLF